MTSADKYLMALTVEMTGVNFHYGSWHALKDIHLTVEPGEVVGLLGHNGAGKTTTIRLLNGLLRPTDGTLRVLGFDPLNSDPAFRMQTSVVNDTLGLPERQTARQAMAFHAQLWRLDPSVAAVDAEELLHRFGLSEVIDTAVKSYSRGMRQRLALARSLLQRPRLLLLDEPTLGMDPVGRKEFRTILKSVAATGASVVMSTHDLGEVERACDNVVILHHGSIMMSGSKAATVDPLLTNIEVTVDFDGTVLPSAIESLDNFAGVTGVERSATAVTFIADSKASIATAVRLLVAAGGDVVGVRSQEPTLEDVYLAMHGAEQS